MNTKIKFYTIIIFCLSMSSCSKDDPTPETIENECREVIDYNHSIDFLDILGTEFIYTNINTGETKNLRHDASRSSRTSFMDTVLCTYLKYDDNINLVYYDQNSGDQISYSIGQFYNNGRFGYSLSRPKVVINGIDWPNTNFVADNIYISHLSENNKRLIYFDENSIIQAFDDLEGNQWLLKGANKNIFYCNVKSNFNQFRETGIYGAFIRAGSSALKYNDGLAPTINFEKSSQSIYYEYLTQINDSCPEQELEMIENPSLSLRFKFADFYSLSINYMIRYESLESNEYSLIVGMGMYHNVSGELHSYSLVKDEKNLFEQSYYLDSPHTFHDRITLSNSEFLDVYEFEMKGRQLYFSLEYGIVAFTDHLGDLNYLEIN